MADIYVTFPLVSPSMGLRTARKDSADFSALGKDARPRRAFVSAEAAGNAWCRLAFIEQASTGMPFAI
jgi:hypothetical protein